MKKLLSIVAALSLGACATQAQPPFMFEGGGGDMSMMGGGKGDKPKSIEETVKSCRKIDGLFTIYQDTVSGSAYLLVKKDQIGKEFIYFSQTVDGPASLWLNRGVYRDSKIFSVNQYYDRIEFTTENPNFYFDPNNAISKAAGANISKSTFMSQRIAAQDSNKNEFLIKADELFLTENISQIKPSPWPGMMSQMFFNLGHLSREKTKYVSLKNYPENTNVVTEYVYENQYPMASGGPEVTDERYVSVKVQHTLLEVPKNDFKPRYDDPRVGYFGQQVNDMTSASITPYRDVINRWHLVKKDPTAALSEPVEPITWWVENTTPVEFRQTIIDAGNAWNKAFEKAGFKNAVVMKVQPDDADWDAGDIRYNVLRWTSSPNPPFGGYGPSFANPRTGQILGADIMLEYVYMTNRLRTEKLFDAAALPFMDVLNAYKAGTFKSFEDFEKFHNHSRGCSAGEYMHMQSLFGQTALKARGLSETEQSEFLKQSLYYLVLHEMGHTMGLNHNMKSSQIWLPADINNKARTAEIGLTGSVMDYPAVNLALDKSKQGQYFTTTPGPYDMWAIEYGYSPASESEEAEKIRLAGILARSSDPQLTFGNDADDMRFPGFGGIDPRVMIGDMSGDAISYSVERIQLTDSLLKTIKTKYSEPGKSYHELRGAFFSLSGQAAEAAGIISRYIGGVYIDRSMVGQPGATQPYTPVPYADQKRAMTALSKHLFAPDAFKSWEGLYAYLQPQRRGFSVGSDPKIYDRALNIQRGVLMHLTSPVVLKRINDSKNYGNTYTVGEFMTDLTNAVFKDDAKSSVNTFRQNLQLEYVNNLITMVKNKSMWGEYDNPTQSMALYSLKNIQKMLASAKGGDVETAAHREHILQDIKLALEGKQMQEKPSMMMFGGEK
jgi:hypothetical protein